MVGDEGGFVGRTGRLSHEGRGTEKMLVVGGLVVREVGFAEDADCFVDVVAFENEFDVLWCLVSISFC